MSLEDRLYPWLRLYERLPFAMRRAAGAAYRRLPRRWRWGKEYDTFARLTREAEGWDSGRMREYQVGQLRRTLVQAESYCPYYQRRFAEAGFQAGALRGIEDLRLCPLLEKRDLLEHGSAMVSTDRRSSHRLYMTTGGSTGVPVGFYLERGVSRPKEQAFLEAMWRRAGYEPGMRLAVIRGHVTSSSARGSIRWYDATRDWLMLSSYHLTEERLPEYLEELERFGPDMLHAYPSAALQLAGYLQRARQGLRVRLRGVLCGSERLTLPQKRMLERVFGCRVYRWYGHSERVVLAGEGRRSEWFYFFPHYGFVELGEADELGYREIIGTSFHNSVMPLIRYRTGDYAKPAEAGAGGAEPEFPWLAVADVAGRGHEFLVGGTGRRISLTAFNMHDDIFDGLCAVQFYQERPGEVEFRYVPGASFDTTRLGRIEDGMRSKLGDDFAVVMREVSETEKTARGKHRWLVSTLDEAAEAEPDSGARVGAGLNGKTEG